MIDAKELRIGNWVEFNGHYKQSISIRWNGEIGHYLIDLGYTRDLIGVKIININHIPLTKEILEKCGFKTFKDFDTVKKKEVTTYELRTSKIIISFVYGMVCIFKNTGDSEESMKSQIILDARIEYLHQLQNLYYALTQTELKIEL